VKKTRARAALRMVAAATAMAAAVLVFTPTSASALNPRSYNILQNAQRNQLCMDMKLEDPFEGGRAQLWSCSHPVTSQQQFIVRATDPAGVPGFVTISNQRSHKCLTSNLSSTGSSQVTQRTCADDPNRGQYDRTQAWQLRHDTGEIVSVDSNLCLTALGDFNGAPVLVMACNGSLAQRWFF
jgi:hypothetical protein